MPGRVLSGEAGPGAQQVALTQRAMASLATPEVDARAFAQVRTIADAASRGRETPQAGHVGGHVRQVLGTGQVMAVGEILHALVPALVVAEVGELLEQDAAVLAGNGGYLAVRGATAVGPVAGGAGLIQLGAVHEIGLEPRALGEFTVARDARFRGLSCRVARGEHQ
jgi:hypothetical protein